MAVKAARERGRAERGDHRARTSCCRPARTPRSRRAATTSVSRAGASLSATTGVPTSTRWRTPIDENTVLVVGSAPQYPQGVIDPIPDIAAIAADRDINCHVDACMGGVTLTYLARLGHDIPPWNFTVPGVTSISVDLHKYGYTAKGASVIMHRNKKLRSYQTFVTDNWLGGAVRLVGRARHEGRRGDGSGVGRDALPRRRRLPAT